MKRDVKKKATNKQQKNQNKIKTQNNKLQNIISYCTRN